MNQHQIRLLNDLPVPSEERFVTKSWETLRQARRWARSAVDAGLEELLSPRDLRVLQDLAERTRRRDVLSAEFSADASRLAGICSRRITELSGDFISPSARARARETNRSRDLVLSEQAVELHALAEAVDEALDLQEALRARGRIARA